MNAPDPSVVDVAFADLVSQLQQRLDPWVSCIAPGWSAFAEACGLECDRNAPNGLGPASADTGGALIVVGPAAFILKHAQSTTTDFGFVMPVAQTAKWWQRAMSWRDDATLALWRAGWSPSSIDRYELKARDATIEFALGTVRLTPVAPATAGD